MKKIILFSCFKICTLCLTSCSYNISMAHTSGTATDVIDDNASNTPNIAPNVNIPVSPTGL